MSTPAVSLGNWRHIVGSLLFAVLLEQWPWVGWALAVRPDFVLLGVLFWTLHQPGRIGIGVAFCLGLVADFQDGVVFGQHAIAYAVGAWLVLFLRLRLLQFDPLRQAAQLFPVLLAVQLVVLLAGWLAVNPPTTLAMLLPVVSTTVLWYLVASFLHAWHGKGLQDRA